MEKDRNPAEPFKCSVEIQDVRIMRPRPLMKENSDYFLLLKSPFFSENKLEKGPKGMFSFIFGLKHDA